MDEADDAHGVRAGVLDPLVSRGETRLRRLRKYVEWRRKRRPEYLAETAEALLDGRALETITIMEYVWDKRNMVLANEKLLRGHE